MRLLGFYYKNVFGFFNLNTGPIGCPKRSVGNYHYSLSNNPQQGGSQLPAGKNRCLFLDSHKTHKYTVGKNVEFVNVKAGGTYSDHWGFTGLNVP